MEILEQLIRLLSEPPGSIIYHLVTLFSLQVVFALSYSRWRRDSEDDQAQRFMWASGGIFLSRLLLLLGAVSTSSNLIQTAQLLPPLEQAINTSTVALIVWSFAPRPVRWPRILDIVLVVTLVLAAVLYLFLAQEWVRLASEGITYYGGTSHAVIWAIIQIIILVSGLLYLLLNSPRTESLPAIILAVLLVAEIMNLWNYSEITPTDTNVPYWIRIGYLIALPLWAIYTYYHILLPLILSETEHRDSVIRFGSTLNEAAEVISTRQRERRISLSLQLATQLLDAAFASIGFVDRRNPQRINFYSNVKNGDPTDFEQWAVDLSRHPTLNAAFMQGHTVELSPTGLGARQLHEFYDAFGIDPMGPLLIQPLEENGANIGLLVIAARSEQELWAENAKLLVPGLASYIQQAIINSQLQAAAVTTVPAAAERSDMTKIVPSAIFLDNVRMNSLEAERDELRFALAESIERRKQSEAKALTLKKQATYLAAALRAAQELQKDQVTDQESLDSRDTMPRITTSQPEETSGP